MDALEFIKYLKKMCAQYGVENQKHAFCQGCPALTEDKMCIANFQFASCDPYKTVEAVEKYAKENPIKTLGSEFLKHYPNAFVDCHGMPDFCPKVVDKDYTPINGCANTSCDECRYKYWMQR